MSSDLSGSSLGDPGEREWGAHWVQACASELVICGFARGHRCVCAQGAC